MFSLRWEVSSQVLLRRELRSFGILRSVDWYLLNDDSGQPIGPVFKS